LKPRQRSRPLCLVWWPVSHVFFSLCRIIVQYKWVHNLEQDLSHWCVSERASSYHHYYESICSSFKSLVGFRSLNLWQL
jgi:hypothetical protein